MLLIINNTIISIINIINILYDIYTYIIIYYDSFLFRSYINEIIVKSFLPEAYIYFFFSFSKLKLLLYWLKKKKKKGCKKFNIIIEKKII